MSDACRRYISKQEIIDRADEVFGHINSREKELDLLRAVVERLRVEALGTQRRIQDQDAIMAELWERIHALTAERDAARAEATFLHPSVCLGAQTASEYAEARGWDCFKEDGHGR